jgi:hypothetical protein
LLIWLLSVMAAIRVFVFSAAFPFFNNVDEQAHFDLVMKYSQGRIPRSLDHVLPESALCIALYGTPEYVLSPARLSGGQFPPPIWTEPFAQAGGAIQANTAAWASVINHEASQAPLYYALAGFWLQLGRMFGVKGGHLLYWIRFLNVFLAMALVWLAFVTARLIFPERRCVQLGVPMLAAFLPQDMFYSIQNDVLSPLCFGLAFLYGVQWLRTDLLGARLAVITGLTVAATGLVKATNLPLLAVVAAVVLFKVWRLARTGKLQAAWPVLALFGLCAALPIGGWLAWNRCTFGDFTGMTAKIELLGWTHKPLGDYWHHPIFTPGGLWTFWSELMASFWRGEFIWFGQRLASPPVDAFFWVSSTVLVGLALTGLLRKSASADGPQREALWLSFWSFAASVAFLALISIAFDFGKCPYPSREHPFFTSGRLLSGALIPFLLLYVYGLDRVLCRMKSDWPRLLALAGIVLIMTVSEIILNRGAFSSQYNWFHLWSGLA